MNLGVKWAPDALNSAQKGFFETQKELNKNCLSCASEVAKKIGANDEEIIMVAGFAGGLGLSGNTCGALAAAVWMNTLNRIRNNTYKQTMSDPVLTKLLNAFYEVTDQKLLCNEITGKSFNTIEEHTEFIKNGGCLKLTDILVQILYS